MRNEWYKIQITEYEWDEFFLDFNTEFNENKLTSSKRGNKGIYEFEPLGETEKVFIEIRFHVDFGQFLEDRIITDRGVIYFSEELSKRFDEEKITNTLS